MKHSFETVDGMSDQLTCWGLGKVLLVVTGTSSPSVFWWQSMWTILMFTPCQTPVRTLSVLLHLNPLFTSTFPRLSENARLGFEVNLF